MHDYNRLFLYQLASFQWWVEDLRERKLDLVSVSPLAHFEIPEFRPLYLLVDRLLT